MNENFERLSKIIKERRAIYPKSFDPSKEVDDALIAHLLENAIMAPTHKKTEPWRFIVIKEEARLRLIDWMESDYRVQQKDAISEIGLQKFLEKPRLSKAVIAIILQRNEESGLPEWEEIAAMSCAAQNLWLSASAAGLGTYWSTPSAIGRMQAFLELATHERCLGLFYIGYPAENTELPTGVRKPLSEKVKWMKQ
jgi:nitroreductase